MNTLLAAVDSRDSQDKPPQHNLLEIAKTCFSESTKRSAPGEDDMFGDDERTEGTKREAVGPQKRQAMVISDCDKQVLSPKFTQADPSDVKIDVNTSSSKARIE